MQVAARHADVHAAHADEALHPRLVQRVGERDLAQLDVAVVLEAGFLDAGERAAGITAAVPVFADRNCLAGARADDGPIEPAALPEHLVIPCADGQRSTNGSLVG